MIVVGLWAVTMIFMNSFQCGTHISALWDSEEAYLKFCAAINPKYTEASALSNVLLDVFILALPIPKVTYFPRSFALPFRLQLTGDRFSHFIRQ